MLLTLILASCAATADYRHQTIPSQAPDDAGPTDQLPELTRLLSLLSHHHALPDVLSYCPELLPALLDFMRQARLALPSPLASSTFASSRVCRFPTRC